MRFKLISTSVSVLTASGLIWVLAGPIAAASADCTNGLTHVGGRGDSGSSNDNIQGIRTSVHTNDSNWQCWSVRSSFVIKDNNEWLEMGWVKASADGTPLDVANETPTVYVARLLNGQPFSATFRGRTPNPDSDHGYKISNGGGDLDWKFEYDDSSVGGDGLYSATFRSGAHVETNSERHKSADNLWDHHDNINICTGDTGDCDGRWHQPDSYGQRVDSANDYDFCRDSVKESHVLSSC